MNIAHHVDTIYLASLKHILSEGVKREDRTGTGTIGVFGYEARYDLQEGFPLLTTKRVYTKGVIAELLFFLTGRTDNTWLNDHGTRIWDEWRRPYTLTRPLVKIPRTSKLSPNKPEFSYDTLLTYRRNPKLLALDFSILDIEDQKLFFLWCDLMEECYFSKNATKKSRAVFMDEQWHDPKRFIADVKTIPHWWYKRNNWENFRLSREFFKTNHYGPNVSVWLSNEEHIRYKKDHPVRVKDEVGNVTTAFLHIPQEMKIFSNTEIAKNFPQVTFLKSKKSLYRHALIPDGDLGPIYGKQWRAWGGDSLEDGTISGSVPGHVDQMTQLLKDLKHNPFSRRHIISAWNPAQIGDMALPPCHTMFQFYVTPDAEGMPWGLSCKLYQRSADVGLGVPFNIASYAALTHLLADLIGLIPLEFIHSFGDMHIYLNHLDQVNEQIGRENDLRPMPTLTINHPVPVNEIDVSDPHLFDRYSVEDFVITGYNPLPAIRMPVAV